MTRFGDISLVPCTQVIVAPGPTTASSSEAEGTASPAMDSLVEGVAGMTGYFNIQVRLWKIQRYAEIWHRALYCAELYR